MEYVFIKRQLKKGTQKKEGIFECISSVTQSFKKKKIKVHLQVLYTFLHHPAKNPNIYLQRQIIRDITEIPQMGK